MGLPGLIFFLILVVHALLQSRIAGASARALGRRDIGYYAVMNDTAIFIMMIFSLAGTVNGLKYFWIMLGMAHALGATAVAMKKASKPPSTGDARGPASLHPRALESTY